MPTTIGDLSLSVKSNASTAINGINALAESLSKLKSATKGGLGLSTPTGNLEKLSETLKKSFSDAEIKKLNVLGQALSGLSGNIRISSGVANQLTKISTAVNGLSRDHVNMLGDLVRDLKELSTISGFKVPSLAGLYNASRRTFKARNEGITSTTDTASTVETVEPRIEATTSSAARLRDVLSSIGGIFQKIWSVGSGAFRSVSSEIRKGYDSVRKFASGIRGAAQSVHQVATKIRTFGGLIGRTDRGLGKMLKSFTRVAAYRAIRKFFSLLTNAMKDGINNLYRYSNALGGTFAASMDRLATSFQYLKNSMGAMVSPLINAIAPAVDMLIDKFVDLLNVINQVFALLTGATSFTKAKKQAVSYGDAIGSAGSAAGKAAKEIEDATIGIDELNIIHEDSGSGSGGGSGGGSALDYSTMFEEASIESGVADFVERLKQAFATNDWSGIGTEIGKKINQALDNVPWDEIGSTIGTLLNGAITIGYEMLKEFDATALGGNIATLINNALDKIDFGNFGGLTARTLTIPIDLVIGFISELDTATVGQSISDFITGFFNELSRWLDTHNWGDVGETLYLKLKDLIKNIRWTDIASSFAEFLGKSIGSSVKLIGGFAKGFGEDIRAWFEEEIKGANWGETLLNLIKWIGEKLYGMGADITTYIIVPLLRGIFGEDSWIEPYLKTLETGAQDSKLTFHNLINGKDMLEGVDTDKYEIPVGLKKLDWDNLGSWMKLPSQWGSDVAKDLGLTKKSSGTSAWSTVSGFVDQYKGTDTVVPIHIERLTRDTSGHKKWSDTTVAGWINRSYLGGAITKGVGLLKNGFDTVYGFLTGKNNWGGTPTKPVNLSKGNWKDKSVGGWVNQYTGGNISKLVNLARGNWNTDKTNTVAKWVASLGGTTVSSKVNLTQGNWNTSNLNTVAKWVSTRGGTAVSSKVNLTQGNWNIDSLNTVAKWVATRGPSTVSSAVNLARNGWTYVQTWADSYNTGGVEVDVSLRKTWFGRVSEWILSNFGGGGYVNDNGDFIAYANGGIIQAANGMTARHGSMFVAGESGAELVGHIGGRTEVMNRFQLASVMKSSILDGFRSFVPVVNSIASQSVTNTNGLINAVLVTADQLSNNIAGIESIAPTATQMAYEESARRTAQDQDMDYILRKWYETYLAPQLSNIAADTKRQADKQETTVLDVNGRELAKAVNKANQQMGYSFQLA